MGEAVPPEDAHRRAGSIVDAGVKAIVGEWTRAGAHEVKLQACGLWSFELGQDGRGLGRYPADRDQVADERGSTTTLAYSGSSCGGVKNLPFVQDVGWFAAEVDVLAEVAEAIRVRVNGRV